MYISSCTNGAAVAPICRPKREQSACGMISPGRGWGGWAGVGGRAQLGGARRLISAPLQSPIAAVCTSRVATTSREVHALRRHGPRCLARRGRSLQAQHARATKDSSKRVKKIQSRVRLTEEEHNSDRHHHSRDWVSQSIQEQWQRLRPGQPAGAIGSQP